MSFPDAVRTVLSKYVDFSGRARRSEYWWFFLFNILVSIVAAIIDAVIGLRGSVGAYGPVQLIASLAMLLPGLALAVRRLHDIDRTGWWLLLVFTIIGDIVLLVFFCTDGTRGQNRFGADSNVSQFDNGGAGYGGPGYGQPGGYGPGSETGWGAPPPQR